MNVAVGYEVLRWLVATCGAAALLFASYAVAGAPSRAGGRLGLRGLKRQRSLRSNPGWAQIEPLVRWFGARASGVLSDEAHAKLDDQIGLAGDYLGLTPDEYLGLTIVSCLGGLLFGAAAGWMTGLGGVLVVVCGLLGAALPYLQVSGEAQRRLKQINRGLPYVVDLMALGMSAGLDFPGAVRQVVEKSSDPNDALVEELTLILQELGLGKTRKQALIEFGRRAPIESVKEFVGAVIQAEERGNPVAEVLQIQATASRQRRSVRAEEAAARAGVAMVGPLFLLFFCIMILVMGPMVLKLATTLAD